MPEQPWFLHYPEGVPHELSLSPETLLAMFSRSAQRYSRRPALYFFGKTLSYHECHALVERFACGLAALGIRKGDRVALCLPNSPQAVIAYFGILRAGGIVVACNPTYTEYELSHQLRDAGARAIVVLDMMYQKIQHLDLETIIVTRITDFMTTIVKYIYQRRNGRPPLEIPTRDTTLFFHDVLDGVTPVAPEKLPIVTPDDIAVLQYTGGTTGVSKGAELRHRNLTANIRQLISWFSPAEQVESFLGGTPALSRVRDDGLSEYLPGCRRMHGAGPDPRNMPILLYVASQEDNRPWSQSFPLSSESCLITAMRRTFRTTKFVICGGAALPYELLKKFKEQTGHLIIEGYGLSEASPATHCNIARGLSVKRSIGLPIANTQAKIVDETGQEVPFGGIGELWVRGPQVMVGYWNNPVETANVMKPEGWLATGDMARMDEDGFFYIVDRKKDMILSTSGFNVYPSEIEKVLLLHPEVREAAVIGVLSGDGSESVKAVVVPSANEISEHDLVKHCRRYLASYKVPKHIEFRSELPRTLLGKTLYRVLREEEQGRRGAAASSTHSGVVR